MLAGLYWYLKHLKCDGTSHATGSIRKQRIRGAKGEDTGGGTEVEALKRRACTRVVVCAVREEVAKGEYFGSSSAPLLVATWQQGAKMVLYRYRSSVLYNSSAKNYVALLVRSRNLK